MPFRCSYNSCCVEYTDEYLMSLVGTPNDLVGIINSGTCPACGKPDVDLVGQGWDVSKYKKPEPKPVKKTAAKKPTKKAATKTTKKEK